MTALITTAVMLKLSFIVLVQKITLILYGPNIIWYSYNTFSYKAEPIFHVILIP